MVSTIYRNRNKHCACSIPVCFVSPNSLTADHADVFQQAQHTNNVFAGMGCGNQNYISFSDIHRFHIWSKF